MTEQFKAIVQLKDVIEHITRVHLLFGQNRVQVLSTGVRDCKLVKGQDVRAFQEGKSTTIISPECGDCPAAVKNGARPPLVCNIYRDNQKTLK